MAGCRATGIAPATDRAGVADRGRRATGHRDRDIDHRRIGTGHQHHRGGTGHLRCRARAAVPVRARRRGRRGQARRQGIAHRDRTGRAGGPGVADLQAVGAALTNGERARGGRLDDAQYLRAAIGVGHRGGLGARRRGARRARRWCGRHAVDDIARRGHLHRAGHGNADARAAGQEHVRQADRVGVARGAGARRRRVAVGTAAGHTAGPATHIYFKYYIFKLIFIIICC